MELLTTIGLSHQLEQLIQSASKNIWLVTPYLKIPVVLKEKLKKADNRGVIIRIVYGKNEMKPDELLFLKELKNSEVYFCKNLHAKVYLNESFGILGSLNLYEFSQINNLELGAVFTLKSDAEFYLNTIDEIDTITNLSDTEKGPSNISKDYLTAEERVEKAKSFYGKICEYLTDTVLSEHLHDNGHISVTFKGSVPNSNYVLSNEWGFITIKSESAISEDIRNKAKSLALEQDANNRFYNHRHANRFCVYDPKKAGDESYLDKGDFKVIMNFIELLKVS